LVAAPPDRHLDGSGASHPFEIHLLENPERFHLEGGKHLPYFIKNRVPPSAKLETPLPERIGSGKCSALVAEELALQERLRQGRAAHGNERLVPPQAVEVNGPGDELLAVSRLAGNKDVARVSATF